MSNKLVDTNIPVVSPNDPVPGPAILKLFNDCPMMVGQEYYNSIGRIESSDINNMCFFDNYKYVIDIQYDIKCKIFIVLCTDENKHVIYHKIFPLNNYNSIKIGYIVAGLTMIVNDSAEKIFVYGIRDNNDKKNTIYFYNLTTKIERVYNLDNTNNFKIMSTDDDKQIYINHCENHDPESKFVSASILDYDGTITPTEVRHDKLFDTNIIFDWPTTIPVHIP